MKICLSEEVCMHLFLIKKNKKKDEQTISYKSMHLKGHAPIPPKLGDG